MSIKKEIKIYSAPTCPLSQMTKKFLQDNGIAYQDLNVAMDFTAFKEMMEKTGQMEVPVIEIDGDVLVGFDPNKLKEKLGI